MTVMTDLYDASRLVHATPITVTLTRPASFLGGATASIPVAHVHEQAADEGEVDSPSDGSLEGERRAFRLWYVECASMPPHRGYLITKADGTVWEINRVEPLSKNRSFRCHATKRPT